MLVSSFKITHIVNAAREVKSPIQGVEYLKVDICDEVTEEIFMHFEEVYQFIDSVWEQDECKVTKPIDRLGFGSLRTRQITLGGACDHVLDEKEQMDIGVCKEVRNRTARNCECERWISRSIREVRKKRASKSERLIHVVGIVYCMDG